MNTEQSRLDRPVSTGVRTGDVSPSKWVNKPMPALTEILSAHEVARVTRRHRWILSALILLGRFPRRQRFRGRRIGWLRRDVADWLARDCQTSIHRSARAQQPCSAALRNQSCLPLEDMPSDTSPQRRSKCTNARTRLPATMEQHSEESNGGSLP
jgi:predicted DNA-binding transcriptional regulator AlpA